VNFKAKIYINGNSTSQRCPNKIIKIFLIEDFFHLPLLLLTPAANLPPVFLTPVANLSPVLTTLVKLVAKFAAGVVDTGGVIDTGGEP
jgi:hypothetical protein